MPSMVSSMGSTWMRFPYLTSAHCTAQSGETSALMGQRCQGLSLLRAAADALERKFPSGCMGRQCTMVVS